MSNRREIEPSLDYFELRRRHEEYKNSQRQKDAPEAEPAPPVQERTVTEPDKPSESAWQAPAEKAEAKDPVSEPEDVSGELNLSDTLDAQDAPADGGDVEDAALLDDPLPDDEDQDEGDQDGNPNPFDPFIHAFKGIRGKLSGRFGRRRQDEEDFDDEALLEDEEAPAENDVAEAAPANAEAALVTVPDVSEADEAPREEGAVEDIFDDAPAGNAARRLAEAGSPDDRDLDDEDYEDDEDEDDDDAPGKVSGFKKFMRLFIVPIDGEDAAGEEAPEDEEYEEAADDGTYADDNVDTSAAAEAPTADGEAISRETDWAAPAVRDNEGGPDMSDLNNVKTELTDALAAGLEGSGMTRRERRELAQRLAAEKAAKEAAAKAEAEAAAQAAETAAAEAGEVVQTAVEKVEEVALEADTIEDVSKGIVHIESAKEDFDTVTDEPTREYKAVSKATLDDLMNDRDLDDDEDEDDEEEEKPVRRGLFGRRRKARDEDEDDYDDDDDEDDDDEDEEEDERPRRGLFGRRRKARDEDEDDEDEDDDYDDEDEDDEEDDRRSRKSRRGRRYDEDDEDEDDYDDYDDDDYDYDDDDDEGTSFGHVLLGILKGFLTAVMLLLFVVVVLNVLNIFNVVKLDGLAKRLPTRMASVFLPSEGMKQRINVEADANPAPVAEGEPLVPQAQPQAEPEPVEEAVVEEEPAEEEPIEEEAPAEEEPAEEQAPEADNSGEAVG